MDKLRKLWAWVRARQYDHDLTIGEVIDAHIRPVQPTPNGPEGGES